MTCDFCDSKATVYFTQILESGTSKQCLCDECAVARGVTDPGGFLLGDLQPENTEPAPPATSPAEAAPDVTSAETVAGLAKETPTNVEGACQQCGFAFDDLKKTGRLGCAHCYQFFRTEIKSNLMGMHKGTSHTGQVPVSLMAAFQHQQAMAVLQAEMDQAIAAEDYEKAAAVRDEIQRLTDSNKEEISS